jgi:hypothetical protein
MYIKNKNGCKGNGKTIGADRKISANAISM